MFVYKILHVHNQNHLKALFDYMRHILWPFFSLIIFFSQEEFQAKNDVIARRKFRSLGGALLRGKNNKP